MANTGLKFTTHNVVGKYETKVTYTITIGLASTVSLNMLFLLKLQVILAMLSSNCIHVVNSISVLSGDVTPIQDYYEEGDLNLGVMLPLYRSATGKVCANGRVGWAAQTGHAIRYILQQVNQNQTLLPNTTLGIALVSDCARPVVAAGRATQFIPLQIPRYDQNQTSVGSSYARPSYDVFGVIGFTSSSKATQASSVLSSYQIPHISWRATNVDLSDKVKYEYFSRTATPSLYETKAVADIIAYYNWTYISVISIDNNYGYDTLTQLVAFTREHGICIAYSKVLLAEAHEDEYDDVINNLRMNAKAKIIVLFADDVMTKNLFLALGRANAVGEFIFILTDVFTNALAFGNEHLFIGSFAMAPKREKVTKEFQEFYAKMPAINHEKDNIWFGYFSAEQLDCIWHANNITQGMKSCEEYENMTVNEFPGFRGYAVSIPLVMDTVLVFVYALDKLINEKCPSAFGDKDALRECVTGPVLLSYVRQVTFQGSVEYIKFDSNGDLMGGYDVTYNSYTPENGYENIKVGTWDRILDDVDMNEKLIKWFVKDNNSIVASHTPPESVCAKPCNQGEFYLQGELTCCWVCSRCRSNEILKVDKDGCTKCPELQWPDQINYTSCLDIAPTFMLWTDPLAIGLESLSAVGITLSVIIAFIFIKHNKRKVVKGSSRELMMFMLFGILLSFLTIFLFLTQPEDVSCYINYFAFHLSCTFIFAPLVLKTIRLYRIFAAAEEMKVGIQMVSASSQVLLILIMIFMEVSDHSLT